MRLGDAEKLVASKAGRGKGASAKDSLNEVLDAAGLLTRKADYEYVTSLE